MASVDRVVFATDGVTIGAFRCAITDPSFRNSGPITDDCFVFPRTTVIIQHDNAPAFVADPTLITLYNRRQQYERRAVSPDGDRCDWFAVSGSILRGALAAHDPAAADDERPIRFTHVRSDAPTYLAQRRIFVDASHPHGAEPLEIEERVVELLDRVLGQAYDVRRGSAPEGLAARAADLADAAKRWMAPRVTQRLTLTRIAAVLNVSPFHLCRSFRRATGVTLHAYRDEVRLRLGLERLEQGESDLTRLALELGYSSHSHFTAAFRSSFRTPPSMVRKVLTARG